MPTVTGIAPQQRRKDRYAVHVDGVYRFSLSQNQLVAAGLRVGDTLTEDQIAAFQDSAEVGKALDRAYSYLSYRLRSSSEVITYLRGKEYSEECVQRVILELTQNHFIDDARFASEWIENRQILNPRSRIQLRAELQKKGIAPDVIEDALQQIDPDAEVAAIVALIESKRLLQRYDDQRKLIQYLASKGFRFDAVSAALEQLETNN
jgi:regulatory protein